MKSTLFYKAKQSSTFVLGLFLLLSTASCSKDQDVSLPEEEPQGENIHETGETTLVFSLAGIDQAIAQGGQGLRASTGKGKNSMAEAAVQRYEAAGFNIETSVSVSNRFTNEPYSSAEKVGESGLKASSRNLRAATAPLANGIKYRIIIYDETKTTLMKNVEAVPGSDPMLAVDAGKKYFWYAVSTNEATVPAMNETTGVIDRAGLTNKDILYASGEITPVKGENYLDILFKHHTIKYTYKIYTSAAQADFVNTSRFSLYYRTIGNVTDNGSTVRKIGDLNVKTGKYNRVTYGPQFTTPDFIYSPNYDNLNTEPYVMVEFYSIDQENIAGNEVIMNGNNFILKPGDGSANISIYEPHIPVATNLPSFDGAYGQHITYTTRFTLPASSVGGLVWAKANLFYKADNPEGKKYLIRRNNNYSDPAWNVEYWSWGAATPTDPTPMGPRGSGDFTDPCTLVYPQGTWRMPTKEEFVALGSFHDKGFDNMDVVGGTVGRGESYREDLDLGFPLLGYRGYEGSGSPNTNISYGPGSSPTYGRYWTSDPYGPGTKQAYNFMTLRTVGGTFRHDYPEMNNSTQNYGTIAEGYNIRCVRPVN